MTNTVSTPKPPKEVSECCGAELIRMGEYTGNRYLRCFDCGKPCNPKPSEIKNCYKCYKEKIYGECSHNPSETNEADYLSPYDELRKLVDDDDLVYETAYALIKSSIERARREGYKDGFEKGSNASHSVFEPNFEVLK